MSDLGREDELERCLHTYWPGHGPQCCRDRGHEDAHAYRCASPGCPGRPVPASQLRHPADCGERPIMRDGVCRFCHNSGAVEVLGRLVRCRCGQALATTVGGDR